MANPSRFTKVGLSGKPKTTYKSDSSLQTLVAKLPVVATTTTQTIDGIVMPDNAIEVNVAVNVIVPEVTGSVKELNIGFDDNPDQLIDGADAGTAGLQGRTGGAGESAYPSNIGGKTLEYSLGSDDFEELEAEAVVTFMTVE